MRLPRYEAALSFSSVFAVVFTVAGGGLWVAAA